MKVIFLNQENISNKVQIKNKIDSDKSYKNTYLKK